MAYANTMTVWGNLVADPELRFTPSGTPVANFRIASTPRIFDQQTREYKDGDALFLSCNVWRRPAQNVANSLRKGDRVIVVGNIKQRNWVHDGQQRTAIELEVEEVGPSLRMAEVSINKNTSGGGFQSPNNQQAKQDVWNSTPSEEQPFGEGDEEPPF